MIASNDKNKKLTGCTSCEEPVVNVENNYIAEENTIIIDSDEVSPQTDSDIFD